jgi:hypothetical protein
MLDTLQAPRAQVAHDNSAAALADLVKVIRAEHSAVVLIFSSAIEHALAAGRALIEAKDLIRHGRWTKFLKDCDLGERQAERYAQLARLYDSNASPGTHLDLAGLSIQAAIRLLSPPKPSEETHERCPTPAAQEKLNSQAWANASPAERARFINSIGRPTLADAIPADWRSAIVEQWFGRKEAPVTIDQNGNVLPEDLSIPPVLDRIQGRSKEEINAERDRLIAKNKPRSHRREREDR